MFEHAGYPFDPAWFGSPPMVGRASAALRSASTFSPGASSAREAA
jgi:hypothetical protein